MEDKKIGIVDIVCLLMILLFTYTAISKLTDFTGFKGQMYNQAIPYWVASVLIWALPGAEIIVSILLVFSSTRKFGLWCAVLLMIAFTSYVALVLFDFSGRTPCACGGVFRSMGWQLHLYFNIFFLILSTLGLIIINGKERRTTVGKV